MSASQFLQQYWPLLALAAWLIYRWWNASRVQRLLPALKAEGAVLLDVRSVAEYAVGHAPDTLNIPLHELGARLGELPRDRPVVVCCASGTRSGMARLQLLTRGFKRVYNAGAWTRLLPR